MGVELFELINVLVNFTQLSFFSFFIIKDDSAEEIWGNEVCVKMKDNQ